MIQPIEKRNISAMVYDQMLELVANKTWKEGDKIPSENELKDQFQVSRNTVRQAIQKMSALGILESRQGEGTFVKKIDTSFYLNILLPTVFLSDGTDLTIFEFEKSIQVESVKLAGKKASQEEIEGLAKYVELMKKATDPEEFFEHDNDYHIYMTLLTKNEMFISSQRLIKSLLRGRLKDVVERYKTKHSIEAHEEIYYDLKNGKIKDAADKMDQHMQTILDHLQEMNEANDSI